MIKEELEQADKQRNMEERILMAAVKAYRARVRLADCGEGPGDAFFIWF